MASSKNYERMRVSRDQTHRSQRRRRLRSITDEASLRYALYGALAPWCPCCQQEVISCSVCRDNHSRNHRLRPRVGMLAPQATVRHASGRRSRSVALIGTEQKGHGRLSCRSARVHGAHVMLCLHGKSVACAGASMQMTQPSSCPPVISSATISAAPRLGRARGGGRPPPIGALAFVLPRALPIAAIVPAEEAVPAAEEGGASGAPPWRQKRCWCPIWPQPWQKKTRHPRFEHW